MLDIIARAMGKKNQDKLNEQATLLAEKATKEEIANIGNASPKGAYATLTDLQTAFPTGANGVYVVQADGKWYYWNGTVWTVGGTYQSSGIADRGITDIKLDSMYDVLIDKSVNLYNPAELTMNERILLAGTVQAMDSTYSHTSYIKVNPGDTLQYSYATNLGGTRLAKPVKYTTVYDVNKQVMATSGATDASSFVVPAGAAYVILSFNDSTSKKPEEYWFMVEKGTVRSITYIPFYKKVKDYTLNSDFLTVKDLPSAIQYEATNLVANSDFSGGTTGWTPANGTGTVANGEYTFTISTLSSSTRIQQTITPIVGHQYYFRGFIKPKYINDSRFEYGGVIKIFSLTDFPPVANQYNEYKCIITATSAASALMKFHHSTGSNYVVGEQYSYKNIQLIDLTETFGVGNEPSISQMDSLLSKFTNGAFNGTTKQIVTFKEAYKELKAKGMGEIVAPYKIPCVIGKTLNIHFDNLLMNQRMSSISNMYARDLLTFEKFAIINPADATVINSDIQAYMGDTPLKGGGITSIIPVATSAGTGLTKKVLVIGDSLTNWGHTTGELLNLFSNDPMKIQLLGTRTSLNDTLNRHEGWSGKTTTDLVSASTLNGETNPFYNPATSTFDFNYYMTNNGYTGVDYVFINMGTNDTKENNRKYAAIIANYNTLIKSIKAYNSNIKICIGMTILQTTLNSFTYIQRNAVLGLIKEFKNSFASREGEGIYLVPNYVHLDSANDFSYTTMAVNPRTTDTVKNAADLVHPAPVGFYKVADIMYNYMKYLATLA